MEIVKEAFKRIESCTTIDQINSIPDDLEIPPAYIFREEKYPKLPFNLEKSDIDFIRRLDLDKIASGMLSQIELTPLEKLLFSVLWKNGDINKIKHVARGIAGMPNQGSNSIVFYQFGRHLADIATEPIIDQHVLRAFAIFKAGDDKEKIDKLKALSLIKKEHQGLVEEYKHWLNFSINPVLKSQPLYTYHIDKVLFALGKYAKATK